MAVTHLILSLSLSVLLCPPPLLLYLSPCLCPSLSLNQSLSLSLLLYLSTYLFPSLSRSFSLSFLSLSFSLVHSLHSLFVSRSLFLPFFLSPDLLQSIYLSIYFTHSFTLFIYINILYFCRFFFLKIVSFLHTVPNRIRIILKRLSDR